MLSDREQKQLLRNTRIIANSTRLPAYIAIAVLVLVFVVPVMLGLLAGLFNILLGH